MLHNNGGPGDPVWGFDMFALFFDYKRIYYTVIVAVSRGYDSCFERGLVMGYTDC